MTNNEDPRGHPTPPAPEGRPESRSAVLTETVEYRDGSQRYVGYLARPSDRLGRGPAILVAHEAPGLGAHARDIAGRLGALGYVAFAIDYVGDGRVLGQDAVFQFVDELRADALQMRRLGQAALNALLARAEVDPARVGALGYCFGGTIALELARGGAPLRAVVGLHSPLSTPRPEDARNITGSVLIYNGAEDPIVPAAQRAAFEAEMRAGGVDWRLYLDGNAAHSFTNPDASDLDLAGVDYCPSADQRSWRVVLDTFRQALG